MTASPNESPDDILKVDALGRVRTPVEQREAILDSFEQSGMPGTRFAKQHGINYQTFASWIQKRRRDRGDYPGAESTNEPKTPATEVTGNPSPGHSPLMLAEVLIEEEHSEPVKKASATTGLRIELAGGTVLVLEDESQAALAATLIRQLSNSDKPC